MRRRPRIVIHLFNSGEYKLHSGLVSPFKIDADALTNNDISALAIIIADRFPYTMAYGVPRGGIRFARALNGLPHSEPSVPSYLIVDDVLTTGGSITTFRKERLSKEADVTGIVIFARGKCPDWVFPLFQTPEFWGLA
jgi:orotate phosphoribosyltransferase